MLWIMMCECGVCDKQNCLLSKLGMGDGQQMKHWTQPVFESGGLS